MKRRIYLETRPLKEARSLFLSSFDLSGFLQGETVDTREALGRVTAEPVFARISSPPFHTAAMDGVAVAAHETFGANVDNPLRLKIGENAFYVNTGQPIPDGTNAVIMIEEVLEGEDGTIEIESPAFPWQYVRKVGEDLVATELILPECHRITAYDQGALLAGGVFEVKVKRRPRVVVLPTGSELRDPQTLRHSPLSPGEVIEYNSVVLCSLIQRWGAECLRHETIPDDPEKIREAVQGILSEQIDLLVINAGSSAGSEDYTASVIEQMGRVLVHGVAIRPGKPTILGEIQGIPVVGNPGYPVSSIISCEEFVGPLITGMLGVNVESRRNLRAVLSRKVPSRLGTEDFVRVRLGKVGDRVMGTPLPRSAGSITTLTQADGVVRIPEELEGCNEGDEVQVELLRDPEQIENTIVIIGSHDLALDLLASLMKKAGKGIHISSSNVGSLGGLMAIRKGHAHMAGSHLLDPETGQYNLPYIRRYLPDMAVKLVTLVHRQQGLIIAKGNPKGIKGLEDLLRDDVRFINRQAGSGTRILLDYRLGQLNITPSRIRGYEREEFTHMGVAVAVLSKAADTGVGIYAAAKALNLDFIPLIQERYDLIIPERFYQEGKIQAIMEAIQSDEFKKKVMALGGYDIRQTGEVIPV